MGTILFNSDFIPFHNASISIVDRAMQFGDGIYEVIRVYESSIFTLDEHIERFFRNCNEIGITPSFNKTLLKENLNKLCSINNLQNGFIYFQISRGASKRVHSFPNPTVEPTFIAYTEQFSRPISQIEKGVHAITHNDIRWLRCDIKSLNLLPNVLGKQNAVENDAFETIFLRDGIVTEGSSSNIFIVKDDTVITHPANHLILNGITRQKVLEICTEHNYSFAEQLFNYRELIHANEVFITSTLNEITPVLKIDEHLISHGNVGKITQNLQLLFSELI